MDASKTTRPSLPVGKRRGTPLEELDDGTILRALSWFERHGENARWEAERRGLVERERVPYCQETEQWLAGAAILGVRDERIQPECFWGVWERDIYRGAMESADTKHSGENAVRVARWLESQDCGVPASRLDECMGVVTHVEFLDYYVKRQRVMSYRRRVIEFAENLIREARDVHGCPYELREKLSGGVK